MGSSSSTPELELPLFGDNDKPTWRGDVNDAMGKLDLGHLGTNARIDATNTEVAGHETRLDDNDVRWDNVPAGIIYVAASGGSDAKSGKTPNTAKATIQGALTALGTNAGTIMLSSGTHAVVGGLAWPANGKASMVGQGKKETIIQVSAQTGPAIDLSIIGNVYTLTQFRLQHFSVVGDGTAGATKKGIKFNTSPQSITGAIVSDIVVSNTGGACFDLGQCELSDFERLIATEPVSAVANDVPYVMATGAFNGNTIRSLLLLGNVNTANVGPSGALIIKDNGVTTPHDNDIVNLRLENLHASNAGTFVAIAGNAHTITNMQMFDCGKGVGTAGTSVYRFTPPSLTDFGGNVVTGVIPGKGSDAASIDCGVDMRQSRNSVDGVKGFRGTNVIIAAGITYTEVTLKGQASACIDPGVIDLSATSSGLNRIYDTQGHAPQGTGHRVIKQNAYYGPGPHVPTTLAMTQSRVYAIPIFIPTSARITSIEAQVTVAGAAATVLRMGIYATAPATDNPSVLVVDGGTVLADTTGVKAVVVDTPLSAGLYWLVCVAQGGAPTVTSVGVGPLPPVSPGSFTGGVNTYYSDGVVGTLNPTFGSASAFTGGPKVMVKAG